MPGAVLVNGSLQEPGLSADRAFHFGDGLFETLAVSQGVPCLWNRHYQRLADGCVRLGLQAPDEALLRSEVDRLCNDPSHDQPLAILKIVLSAGPLRRGYARDPEVPPTRWLSLSPWPAQPHYIDRHAPLELQWCETRLGDQPMLAGLKHLNRLEQVMARSELRPTAQEGIVCDLRGNVVEGTASNLFLRFAEGYVTPELSCCGIAGVVRQLVIDGLRELGIVVDQAVVSRERLLQADAVYLCSSLLGVRAAAGLGSHRWAGPALPPTLRGLHLACFDHHEVA